MRKIFKMVPFSSVTSSLGRSVFTTSGIVTQEIGSLVAGKKAEIRNFTLGLQYL